MAGDVEATYLLAPEAMGVRVAVDNPIFSFLVSPTNGDDVPSLSAPSTRPEASLTVGVA